MSVYSIKSNPGESGQLSILEKNDDGYMVQICLEKDGYQKISQEFMPISLFETCLRTGYIVACAKPEVSVA